MRKPEPVFTFVSGRTFPYFLTLCQVNLFGQGVSYSLQIPQQTGQTLLETNSSENWSKLGNLCRP